MEGYYWAILASTILGLCGIGVLSFLLAKVLNGIECVKSMLRILVGNVSDADRNAMSRHAETMVVLERMSIAAPKEDELTEEERELQRKQEQAFSDGVSNILNYGVDKK